MGVILNKSVISKCVSWLLLGFFCFSFVSPNVPPGVAFSIGFSSVTRNMEDRVTADMIYDILLKRDFVSTCEGRLQYVDRHWRSVYVEDDLEVQWRKQPSSPKSDEQ